LIQSAAKLVADFITLILSEPNLQNALVNIVVKSMNAFMGQEEIGEILDVTAQKVIYDKEKRRQASKKMGQEVVPLVTDFTVGLVGGLKDSMTPTLFKKKKKTEDDPASVLDSAVEGEMKIPKELNKKYR
jgi:capsular polysaccharide biosynthesis protein